MEKLKIEIPLKLDTERKIEGRIEQAICDRFFDVDGANGDITLKIDGYVVNGELESTERGNEEMIPDSPPLEIEVISMKLLIGYD